MKKALYIAQKNIKEVFRNLKNNAILFVLPLAFIAIFGLAFGRNNNGITFGTAFVKNENPTYSALIEELKKLKNGDNEVFKLTQFDTFEDAKKAVEDRKQLGIIEWKQETGSIAFHGDTQNSYYGAASGVLSSFSQQFFQQPPQKFAAIDLSLASRDNATYFQLLVPGLIVYAILLLIIQTAQNLSEVKEKKQIFRYFTSRATSLDIIIGYLLSMSVIALAQTAILFAAAHAFGFRTEGNILIGVLVCLLTCLFAVGVGLLIGAFVGKPEPAANLGSLISLILGFFSGSFILGIENVIKFGEINGVPLRLVDFVPSFYATQAMKEALLYGKGLGEVSFELAVLLGTSLFFLVLGTVVFQRRQLRSIE
jgi:ABC-type multidrug transport system permease subunit